MIVAIDAETLAAQAERSGQVRDIRDLLAEVLAAYDLPTPTGVCAVVPSRLEQVARVHAIA